MKADDDPFLEADDDDYRTSLSSPTSITQISNVSNSCWSKVSIGSTFRTSTSVCQEIRKRPNCSELTSTEGLTKLRMSIEIVNSSRYLHAFETAMNTIRDLMECDYTEPHHFQNRGLVKSVCQRLRDNTKNHHVAEECCRFLTAFFRQFPDTVDCAHDCGAETALCHVVEDNFDIYSSTAKCALSAIELMSNHSSQVRRSFRECRGLQWCLVCLRHWPDIGIMQRSALNCLLAAIRDDPENKVVLANLGMIQDLSKVVIRHRSEWETVECCTNMLTAIGANSVELRRQVLEEGLLGLVITVFSESMDQQYMLKSIAEVVRIFCVDEIGRKEVGLFHGVKPLAKALRKVVECESEANSPKHRDAIRHTIEAVQHATRENETSYCDACTAENMETLTGVYQQYENDHEIVKSMLRMLYSLVKTKRTAGSFMLTRERSAMECLVRLTSSVLSRNVKIASITDWGISIMLQICTLFNPDFIRKFSHAEFHGMLKVAVHEHAQYEQLVFKVIQLAMQLK